MLADDFFDLKSFEHASLFDKEGFVWEALKRIGNYLSTKQLGQIKGVVHEGAHLINRELIFIDEGSVVEAGATIIGPCYIGKGNEIRQGAYLRGNVVTGSKCVIGHASEAKNAILFDSAHAAHFAYVGDTILGARVNLGAGVKCANFRFDGQNIRVEKKDTGLRKFGAIIGDDAQIGCNAVTNPGTLIGKRARCYPCLNIYGIIPADTTLKTGQTYELQTENR